MQKRTSGAISSELTQRDTSAAELFLPLSIIQHASCALHAVKQSAVRLSRRLLLESPLPIRVLAASWLLVNVLLPLLLLDHPLARSTLLHACSAVCGSVALHRVLGDSPLVFASCLSLLPLLAPHQPAAFVEVEGRTILLLPRLLFPRLLPLWRQVQLVVNTLAVAAAAAHIRRHVTVGRRQAEGSHEASMQLNVPVVGREVRTGVWELDLTVTVRARRGGGREDEMDTELEAEEGAGERQQETEHAEWSPEEKREREEAEYPRAPPSSPADFPLKMRVAVTEQPRPEPQPAEDDEGRAEFQSPRPRARGTAWDVKALRRVLDPMAAEHQCFKSSDDTIAAPHGDPILQAERRQQQHEQPADKQRELR